MTRSQLRVCRRWWAAQRELERRLAVEASLAATQVQQQRLLHVLEQLQKPEKSAQG